MVYFFSCSIDYYYAWHDVAHLMHDITLFLRKSGNILKVYMLCAQVSNFIGSLEHVSIIWFSFFYFWLFKKMRWGYRKKFQKHFNAKRKQKEKKIIFSLVVCFICNRNFHKKSIFIKLKFLPKRVKFIGVSHSQYHFQSLK